MFRCRRVPWMVLPALLPILCAGAADVKVTPIDENPKITLKLKDVTAAETMDALSKASGIPVSLLPGMQDAAGAPKSPQIALLDQKASFDWSGITFARALRQLMEHYKLRPMMGG